MHFEGYPSDEDEPLHSLEDIRFSSLAAEAADCPKVRAHTACRNFAQAAVLVAASLCVRGSASVTLCCCWQGRLCETPLPHHLSIPC